MRGMTKVTATLLEKNIVFFVIFITGGTFLNFLVSCVRINEEML